MTLTTRPVFIPLADASAFPPELLTPSNWTAYDLEGRDGKFTKIPYNPHTGQWAKSNDPATWGTFAEAYAFAAKRGMGVMFMLAPPFFAFDLDDCYDDDGQLSPLAVSVLGEIYTYTERSVSRKGVKGIGYGKKPGTRCRRKGLQLEIYDRVRPLALTGDRLPDAPLAINDCQEGLDFIHGAAFGDEQAAPAVAWNPAAITDDDDQAVLDSLRNFRNGAKFDRYWNGQDDGDPSGGDQGLANMIAWRVGPDMGRIEALFNASARAGRDKWQKRADYRERTIRKAIERCNGRFYEARPAFRPLPSPTVTPATAQPVEDLDPVLAEYLALPHEELARRAYRAEQLAARAQKTLSSVIKVRSNPFIKAERDTLTACIVDIKAERANGRGDAEGWVRQPAVRIAETAGKGDKTVSKHRHLGEEWGLIELKLVQETDQTTGQRRTVTYARTIQDPDEALDALVTLNPDRGEKKDWGGKREPCPRCGSTKTRTVTYCGDCELILKETQHDGDPGNELPTDEAGNVPPTPIEDLAATPPTYPHEPLAHVREDEAEDPDTWDPHFCNHPRCTQRLNPALGKRFCWQHRETGIEPEAPPVRPPANLSPPFRSEIIDTPDGPRERIWL
jgi:putative DNA primase/helicase